MSLSRDMMRTRMLVGFAVLRVQQHIHGDGSIETVIGIAPEKVEAPNIMLRPGRGEGRKMPFYHHKRRF